ncbi:hypothetical protein Scep_014564 [Stephania cephalantha]|uniref:Uncharacterized protein n=1 Tax=Stephania cephalantha TaxID=152367 RepID=A0AAP0J3D9_9MAGN
MFASAYCFGNDEFSIALKCPSRYRSGMRVLDVGCIHLRDMNPPVYSVCHHYKENIQFIFSTALDGKIKAWLYDCLGSRVDYDAPGLWCTTMAYSAD